MDYVCTLISEWRLGTLKISNQKNNIADTHSFTLRVISEIKFPNLKEIRLFDNKMETIEGLHRISMPALQDLYISTDNGINRLQ